MFYLQRILPPMKSYCVLLPLLFILSGCLATPIKPSPHQMDEIRTMLVVPVEPPPLEVTPDPIESRFPVYNQFQYQSIPSSVYLKKTVYKNPGGVLIAGLLSKDDDMMPIANIHQTPASMEKIAGLEPTASLSENWTPTFTLAQEAVSQLNGDRIKAILSKHYYHLPMASGDRNANLDNWRSAIEQWYNLNISSVDYRRHGLEQVDAVLEVGIQTYRIFNAQTSLQVLIKLIDPNTRQVIGRISAKTLSVEDSPESLLNNEAERFKWLVADMGAHLVSEGLSDLGLPVKAPVDRLTP
ncbi:hypothetical protein Mettu_2123 [Methylobacter tundripaludum SV96]|uniref:Lipoprotein n=2 Tax=Methylobacter tundripaludum TaxID=173365 RepID=G3IQS4_METTV|nr:hypothetical protein Mettu_2123 [Methylobacter tundripaludum SV96]